MKNYSIVFALALMAAAGTRGEMGRDTITSATTEIYGGMVYTVQGNVTINGGTSASAITVKSGGDGDGKRVVIDIPADCSLTVTGGAGSGRSGGGAGILLPSDMTLYVTGKGRLTVTGGKAANGGNGSNGGNAEFDDDGTNHFKNGGGGDGGDGGGGAGAGIGGNGGGGASGGRGAAQSDWRYTGHSNNFPDDGKEGGAGANGADGNTCGSVFILGDVTVSVSGGAAGAAGSAGTEWGETKDDIKTDDWHAGGGGPGGGGAGGGSALAIGGGGGGGGAGGGGGSGSYVVVDNSKTYFSTRIYGGKGGNGGGGVEDGGGTQSAGEPSEEHSNYDEDKKTSMSGKGGDGGNGGKQGGNGNLYVLPSVGLSISPHRASDAVTPSALGNFLTVTLTFDLGLKDGSGAPVAATLPQPFANRMVALTDVGAVNPRIKRAGYRFAGYWTDDGTCVYGPDYKPTMALSPFTENMTLRARWEVDSSILSVTSSGDASSTLDVYGNTAITLRDAVQALVTNSVLVGTDGRRRVTFEKLDATNTVVRLASEIEVPAGVRSFEINGLYGLEKGVEIVAGANSRHFNFKGKASDDGAFSLASLTFTGGNPTGGGAGGSILVNDASVFIDACSFLGNRTGDAGGAIAVNSPNGSDLLVSSTTFAGNSASGDGGALRLHGNGARALIVNTTLSGNVASGAGGGIAASDDTLLGMLACTFAHNKATDGLSLVSTAISAGAVEAVNCIFADKPAGGEGTISVTAAEAFVRHWCSVGVDSAKVFASHGAAVTQVVAGVTHVVHPPLGGASAGNEDAAEIYHDPSYDNVLAVGRDGREVLLYGERAKAKIPFIIDQLQAVRTAPTRGAVRLAVGTEPVTVELDGVLRDTSGKPKANQTVSMQVTVSYSDGEAAPTNLVIKTADYGVFGLSVPVDGSDGLAHNVTGVRVDRLGPQPIAVTMAPYALTAASVELLGSNDYVPLYGEAIAIGNVAAGSISVTNSFDARSASSFTAGALKGFGKIDLEHIDISGGTLDWLGGANPPSSQSSETFADLAGMTVGGGADAKTVGTISGSKVSTWTAQNDGFFQLQAQCQNPKGTTLKLDVVDADEALVAEVTPQGTLGNETSVRRFIWTVPVRKDDTVRMTLSAGELTLVKGQFIYFGVKE